MDAKKRKSPGRNLFWRDGVLHGRIKIKGHDHKWSLHTIDVKTAKKRVVEGKEKLTAIERYGERRRQWPDIVVGWHDSYLPERNVSASTIERYMVSLGQIEPWLVQKDEKGNIVSAKWVDEIDDDLVDLIVDGRRQAGASLATIRRDLTAFSSVLKYALSKRLREGNPALDKQTFMRERHDPIVLPDPRHVDMVIAAAPGLVAEMTAAARATGCRQDELLNAPRSALDHARRELTIIGKGNKLRVIDLVPFGGYEILASLPAHTKTQTLFWHSDGETYKNFSSQFSAIVRRVFLTAYDATHGTTSETRAPLQELLEQQDEPGWVDIGFRTFRFHDLRHLHAVEWLREGRPIGDLTLRLGHESVKTTEQFYLKYLTPEQKRIVQSARSQRREHDLNQGRKVGERDDLGSA